MRRTHRLADGVACKIHSISHRRSLAVGVRRGNRVSPDNMKGVYDVTSDRMWPLVGDVSQGPVRDRAGHQCDRLAADLR